MFRASFGAKSVQAVMGSYIFFVPYIMDLTRHEIVSEPRRNGGAAGTMAPGGRFELHISISKLVE